MSETARPGEDEIPLLIDFDDDTRVLLVTGINADGAVYLRIEIGNPVSGDVEVVLLSPGPASVARMIAGLQEAEEARVAFASRPRPRTSETPSP